MAYLFGIDHFSNSMLSTGRHPPSRPAAPRWLWHAALAALFLVAGSALLCALAIALGATDPPRAARLAWEAAGWPAADEVTLAPGESGWAEAPVALPAEAAFTLEVRARLAPDADPGAAWGVWIETADGARLVYALSGEGALTTRRCPPGDLPPALEDCPAPRPEWRWAAYPRLKPPGEINLLAVHREQLAQVRLWINGERLGASALTPAGAWGVWWRGGRSAPTALAWESAALYRD